MINTNDTTFEGTPKVFNVISLEMLVCFKIVFCMLYRLNKYDEKLAIKGTFADVFKVVKKNKEEKKNNLCLIE